MKNKKTLSQVNEMVAGVTPERRKALMLQYIQDTTDGFDTPYTMDEIFALPSLKQSVPREAKHVVEKLTQDQYLQVFHATPESWDMVVATIVKECRGSLPLDWQERVFDSGLASRVLGREIPKIVGCGVKAMR